VTFEEELKTKLGTRVDVVFKSRLRPYIAERMTRDKVRLL
jgi:predicted nucleotidyltransferase